MDAIRSIRGRRMGPSGPRTWPVRALPNWLVAFIAIVVLGDAVLISSNIAALSLIAPGAAGGERVQVTVSIGVAALDSGGRRDLAELMAAADAALYRAKAGGRDQVQMISTARGLSASAS